MRGSDACLLVFALNNQKSFNSLQMWYEYFCEHTNVISSEFPFFVVGTHALGNDRVVSIQMGLRWCGDKGPNFSYWEVENTTGDGVEILFRAIAEYLALGACKSPFNRTSVKSARTAT